MKMSSNMIFSRNVELKEMGSSLLSRISETARESASITFVGSAASDGKGPEKLTWKELHRDALAVAAALQVQGISPGDHVAFLGPTTRNLVTALQAAWLAGACVTILPIPMRLDSIEKFISQCRGLMKYGDCSLLLLDPDMAAYYQPDVEDPQIIQLDQVQPGSTGFKPEDYREVPEDPERLAILQFTSGATSEPKGVMLPHRCVCANVDGMIQAAEVKLEDILVSWLPLYHDMGLIGFLTLPMILGCSLILASPQDFLSKPANWMRWLDEYKATITAGPNFSWVLASRTLKRMKETGESPDLSNMRIALNGAEPIDPQAVDRFVEIGREFGFPSEAVFCAFGIAEVTLAGSFSPPMRGMVCDVVERFALEEERIARPADPEAKTAKRLPLLGEPLPGLEMRIWDLDKDELKGIREVGELEIRGKSLTTGYYKRPDLRETQFNGEWLRTGDLAYFVEPAKGENPELVLCGRIKDVIIVSGRNIFPEDIERAAGEVEGIRTGNVIAFGVEGSRGKESIAVVAETKEQENFEELRKNIRQKVVEVCSVPPKDIKIVPPGTVPKTSSGKLQRSLCKKKYYQEEL